MIRKIFYWLVFIAFAALMEVILEKLVLFRESYILCPFLAFIVAMQALNKTSEFFGINKMMLFRYTSLTVITFVGFGMSFRLLLFFPFEWKNSPLIIVTFLIGICGILVLEKLKIRLKDFSPQWFYAQMIKTKEQEGKNESHGITTQIRRLEEK